MTVEVGNIIVGYLQGLTFIDKLAGVVKTITKSDVDGNNNPIRKTFPVACGLEFQDCINKGKYQDLVPDSKLKSIVYLEDSGIRLIRKEGYKNVYTASYRLVSWINQKALGYVDDCSITSKIIDVIISRFPDIPQTSGYYQELLIDVVGQDPKSLNPFSKYSYDEDRTQYLMRPFDYFSLQLEVTFKRDRRCAYQFEEEIEAACNNEFN